MNLRERIARRFGFVPASDLSAQARNFNGAALGRLTAGWATGEVGINRAIYRDLETLRARAKEAERNNDYVRRFVSMAVRNIIGPTGVALQVQAKRPDGSIDVLDSTVLENKFYEWSRRKTCDVTGRYTWLDMQRLIIRRWVIDGEVLVRRHAVRPSAANPFGYSLQLISADNLDTRTNSVATNGNRIVMGVEIDELARPVAYHLKKAPAGNIHAHVTTETVRVSAAEIWHIYLPDDIEQLRGFPVVATPLRRLRDLDGYEEAAVIAARVGAAKMGVLEKAADAGAPAMLGTVPGTDAQAPQISAEPGEFMGLPEGYTLSSWNPQYPHEQFGAFVKSTLRGISAGLDVSYHTLAGDLEAVNFSSARAGTLEERETWKGLQQWLIESLCEPLYTEWLQYALAAGALAPLPPSRFDKFNAALWQGRRWSWVDPMKDVQANAMAIEQGLTTRGRVIREQGGDPEEIWLELEKENARLAAVLPQRPAAAQVGEPDEND